MMQAQEQTSSIWADDEVRRLFDCVLVVASPDAERELRRRAIPFLDALVGGLPVVLVECTPQAGPTEWRPSSVASVEILRLSTRRGLVEAAGSLVEALTDRRFLRPLLWCRGPQWMPLVASLWSPCAIMHAARRPDVSDAALLQSLERTDLVIASNAALMAHLRERGLYEGVAEVLPGIVHPQRWSMPATARPLPLSGGRLALMIGDLTRRVDYDLLARLSDGMPAWDFVICGEVLERGDDAAPLLARPNVRLVSPGDDELRMLAAEAVAAILPLSRGDADLSLPPGLLDALGAGLPVVAPPLAALEAWAPVVTVADDLEAFEAALEALLHAPKADAEERQTLARRHAPEHQAVRLRGALDAAVAARRQHGPLEILVMYDDRSTVVSTVQEHLAAFGMFSENRITYLVSTQPVAPSEEIDLSPYDAVVIHYSVRISVPGHFGKPLEDAVRRYGGYKIAFIQDEYDTVEITRCWLEEHGVHTVYTCVPRKHIHDVYPADRFGSVDFVETLTGFVPLTLHRLSKWVKPLAQRTRVIGYRGRHLPYWYGLLGQEKLNIGIQMHRICQERGIEVDIKWEFQDRIYGNGWYQFLAESRTTMGTESGCNVFDFDGEVRGRIERALKEKPDLTFEEAFEPYLAEHEGRITMNQISPKLFEAIGLRTGLILFEGSYSGVVRPYDHFIPLKKDFSNVDEVLRLAQDVTYLEQMTQRAYDDVVASGRYTYEGFVAGFDAYVRERVRPLRNTWSGLPLPALGGGHA